jgi:aspartate-semialdehyde dehydrogenase
MVGQRFIQALNGHPDYEVSALFASPASAGRPYKDLGKWLLSFRLPEAVGAIEVHPATAAAVEAAGLDIVFSALPSDVARPLETAISQAGTPVFSNASAHRMDPEVPLLIPEVNAEHIEVARPVKEAGRGVIVTNANCSTTGLVMGLKPLASRFTLEDVVVSTYQAVSGAGADGIRLLTQPFNVIPHIEKEEAKVEAETRRIMGTLEAGRVSDAPFGVVASCARVWVRDGHLESVVVRLKERPTIDEVRHAFATFESPIASLGLRSAPARPVVLMEDQGRPQPALDALMGEEEGKPGMSAAVGQVRLTPDGRVRFFVLSHNTIRGSAGGSVLNAELAAKKGLLPA